MGKKIIFLDIDGTLTEPGSNTPPESALEAIKKTQAKGNLVFLCTGRNYNMLSPLLVYGFDGVIGSSGAYVKYKDEILYDCPMTDTEQKMVMEVLSSNGVFRTIECVDGAFTDEGFKKFLEENASQGSNSELLRWRKQIEGSLNIRPMSEYSGQPVYKVIVMASKSEQLDRPKNVLSDKFHMVIQEPDKFGITNGEIIKKDYDKGSAVRLVCKTLDIPIEDSYGYGDSMNDLEMIQTVGHSVCMENGSKALKDISDEICGTVGENGIYNSFKINSLL